MVDAELSESLDSTCPSKKGCQFVDAAGGSSRDVGLMVASTSRVSCSARLWATCFHSGTSSVGSTAKKICGNSDSLIFYVFVLSIIPLHEGQYSPEGFRQVKCLLQPFSAAIVICVVVAGFILQNN